MYGKQEPKTPSPRISSLVLLTLILSGSTFAQTPTVPVGDQFLVNSYTTGAQYFSSVAMNDDGAFVVAWTSTDSSADSEYGVFGRLYASDGQTVGGEFLVNTFTGYNQYAGGVLMNDDGSFVVAWDGYEESSYVESIFAQRYAPGGAPSGGELLVGDAVNQSFGPAVAGNDAGDFLIVWNGFFPDDDAFGVRARRMASDGTPVGDSFAVNTYTTGDQEDPDVALDADGDFLVVWSNGPFASSDILGRRFSSDGAASGSEFLISGFTSGRQSGAAVATTAVGDFLVVWQTDADDNGDGASIQAQRFDSGGAAIGAQFLVNSYTSGIQSSADVAMDPSGDFLVVWSSAEDGGGDNSQSSVQAQRFTSEGEKIGAQFRVNDYTLGTQVAPVVDVDGAGDFVVSWSSSSGDNGDPANFSVQARRYRVSAGVGDFVFEDQNRNGLQDAGESGVAGVAVRLYSELGVLLDSTQTDEQGAFLFRPKIALAGVADRYYLEVEAPEAYVFTMQNVGADDEIDSDVDSFGRTETFEILSAGETRREFDAGLYSTTIFADGFESGDLSAWSGVVP